MPVPLRKQLAQTWLVFLSRVDNTLLFGVATWFLDQLRPLVPASVTPGSSVNRLIQNVVAPKSTGSTGSLVFYAYPPQTIIFVECIGLIFLHHKSLLLALSSDAIKSIIKMVVSQQQSPSISSALLEACLAGLTSLISFQANIVDGDTAKTLISRIVRPVILEGDGNIGHYFYACKVIEVVSK